MVSGLFLLMGPVTCVVLKVSGLRMKVTVLIISWVLDYTLELRHDSEGSL